MKCPNCNKKLEEKTNFCIYCGTDLEKHPPKKLIEEKIEMKEVQEITIKNNQSFQESFDEQMNADAKYSMQCSNCNHKLEQEMSFCIYCGIDLEKHPPKKIIEDKTELKKGKGKLDKPQSFQEDNDEDIEPHKKAQTEEIKDTSINKKVKIKKRRKWPFLLLIPIIIALSIWGYIEKQEIDYDTAINNGVEAINDYDYDEAINQFKEAMEFKSDDELAEQLHDVTTNLSTAKELYENDDLDAALTKIDQISDVNPSVKEENEEYFDLLNGHTQILKTKIEDLINKHRELLEDLESAKSAIQLQPEFSIGDLESSMEIVLKVLSSKEIEHPYFSDLKKDVESFQSVLNKHRDDFIEFEDRQNKIKEELALYSAEEIEYARIILMLGEPEGSVVYVSHSSAESPVFNHSKADPDVVFPNKTISLSGEYVPYGYIVYSPIGGGYIDLYPMPYRLNPERKPEEYREQALQILSDAERLYIEEADNEVLLEKLKNTTFKY